MRHAVIAGGGFAGLTVAVALLQRGWSVTVCERAASVRSEGYNIAFHENGLRSLEVLGLMERAIDGAQRMPSRQTRDRHGRVTAEFDATYRVFRVSRPHLAGVLAAEAQRLGAEFRFTAEVAGARPEGVLLLEDGTALRGDLVVAADGVNSRVRDSLGLLATRKIPGEGAIRVIMPRTPGELGPDDDGKTGFEFWSGKRRFMYRPATAGTAYCTFTCPADDERGRQVPIDAATWMPCFPTVAHVIGKAAREADWAEARWAQYQIIRLKSWSQGRVAVVGDAAHAMEPNLGQGANCAIMNALALALTVADAPEVEAALREWERSERPIIEHAQRWSSLFTAPLAWPEWLWSVVLPRASRTAWFQRQMTRPARHEPKGYAALRTAG
jgi:2-polyprenyl-6-methoxyphenol hydroxylase-like FAD-dependent oxidoreductase